MKHSLNLGSYQAYRWPLFYCAVASLGSLSVGYGQTYYTGVQGMQAFFDDYGSKTSNGTYALTTQFLSLSTSILYVGEIVGALTAAPINESFGRKAVFYVACACNIIGAILHLCGSQVPFLVGRILVGMSVGHFSVTSMLYIGEVAPLSMRGPALMAFQLMQSTSQIVAFGVTMGTEETISTADSYRIPFGLVIVLPGLMAILLPFTVESPTWYIMKGKVEQAEESLRKINRDSPKYTPSDDLRALQEAQASDKGRASSWMDFIRFPSERRKLIFACGAMVAQQSNGVQFFYSYGVTFAKAIGMNKPYNIFLGTCILQIVVVSVSVFLGNRLPRRRTVIIFGWVVWVSLIIIGGLGAKRSLEGGIGATIIAFSYVVIGSVNFSLGGQAYTIAAEVAVGRNRNRIMACSIVTLFFIVWLVSFTAPYLYYSANLGPLICFIYAVTGFLMLAYIWFCVGETAGRTNAEIERFFVEKIPARQWERHIFVDGSRNSTNWILGTSSKGNINEKDQARGVITCTDAEVGLSSGE